MSKKAMKLALEALHGTIAITMAKIDLRNKAIKALEEALAKQEQGEPVAEIVEHGGYAHVDWKAGLKHPVGTKFYTTPQQCKPLTFEKVYELWLARFDTNEYDDVFMNFARAIEAAHGIKE